MSTFAALVADTTFTITVGDTAATILATGIGGILGALGKLAYNHLTQLRQDRQDQELRHDKDRADIKELTNKVIELSVQGATAVTATGKTVQENTARIVDLQADVKSLMHSVRQLESGGSRYDLNIGSAKAGKS